MPELPLIRESNDKHQTLVIVVAWFFTVLGAATALKTTGRLIITFWTQSLDYIMSAYTAAFAVELLFSISAFVIGLGMLNRRTYALRNAIAVAWLYLLWSAGALIWGLATFWLHATKMAQMTLDAPELVKESIFSGYAYTIYGFVGSVVTIAVCFWLARKLSLPIIRNAFKG